MSRKQPEIKVIYPDASAAAMLLTDAMIRRSTGKRVVETNSEEKEYTGEQLFGGVLSTKTDTSVELTLRLNPDAMDYALTMLVAKNLTEEEKRAIRMETDSMEIVDLLSPRAQAAQAPGQALDGRCSPDVPSAERGAATQSGEQDAIDVPLLEAPREENQIEIGKVPEKKLRDILNDMIERMEKGHGTFDAVNHAVWEIKQIADEVPVEQIKLAESWVPQKIAAVLQAAGCSKKSKTLDPFARGLIADLEKTNKEDEYYISLSVLVALVKKMAESKGNDPFALYSVFGGETASWDEIEQQARMIGQSKHCTKKSAAPLADTACGDDEVGTQSEPTDGEIEPGLLNDIEDGPDDQDYIDGYMIRKAAEEERHG